MVSYGKFVAAYHFICDTMQSHGLVDLKLIEDEEGSRTSKDFQMFWEL